MKTLIMITTMLMIFSGCGDSGSGATTTNPTGSTGSTTTTTNTNTGSTATATEGMTPYSYGESTLYPLGEIGLEFDIDTSGSVFATGGMTLAQQFGSLACVLPAGDYVFLTAVAGAQKSKVHHYGGITLNGTGPVAITAVLDNTLSIQNQNGKWVMDAIFRITAVSGSTCVYQPQIRFSMPLAQ